MIFVAAVLILAFCYFFLAIIRLPGRAAVLVGAYLLGYANIVLVGEISNSIYQLNNMWIWLVLHLILAVGVWLLWFKLGRPALWLWAGFSKNITLASWYTDFKKNLDLWLMAGGVSLAYLFQAALIWACPPNNNDSLATHLARIGFWLQRGSFFPWPSDRVWQITYPVNMQLQMFWTVLFTGSDRIVEGVQWVSALVAIAAVFGLAQLMGASPRQAMFAGLVWATFPEIVLESTTTQNDLVAGTLFSAMLYLLFLGLSKNHKGALILSGLALALGLGTKQTLFFLIPGLAISVSLAWFWSGRQVTRSLLLWGGSAIIAFILLSAYMFVVNQVNYGHPLGPEVAVTRQTGGMTSQALKDHLVFNTFRLSYQAIDPTGLPEPLTGYGFKVKALVVGKLANLIGFPVESSIGVAERYKFVLRERYVMQEDAAWYGPIFAFLVIPAMLYQSWIGVKKKDTLRVSIFILSITFWLLDAVLRPGWDPFQGRYFIPIVTISSATTAFVFQPGRKMRFVGFGVTILALIILWNSIFWNVGKPLSGDENVWTMNRIELITRQSFYMRDVLLMVDRTVPADATLGLVTMNKGLEYPYFRENFSRRLVHIYPFERLNDTAWLKGQGIDYVLVYRDDTSPVLEYSDDLIAVANTGEWTIRTWIPGP